MTSHSPAAGRKNPGHAVIKGRPATGAGPEAGNLAVLLMASRTTSNEATSASNAF